MRTTLSLTMTILAMTVVAATTEVAALGNWQQWHNSLKPQGEPGQEIALAVSGNTEYVIVIPEQPTPQEQKAAEELAHWLGEMTGAEFPVVSDAEPAVPTEISVGRTSRLAKAGLAVANQGLGEEGYAIAQQGQRLFLIGGTKRGPLNAVYCLLEEDLGCRWYSPEVTRVLQRPTVRVKVVLRKYIPPVKMRNPRGWSVRDANWCLRNQVNGNNAPIPEELGGHYNYAIWCHSFRRLVPPDKHFDEHPEYYSLVNGKRTPRQLCVTNMEAAEIAARNVIKILDEHPQAEFISVSYNDGRGFCECERCTALNEAEESQAGSLIPFVNRVAEIVEPAHPDVFISTLAYLETGKPPKTVRPRHNVAIRFCTDRTMWPYPFKPVRDQEEYLQWFLGWTRIHKPITIWDYPVNYSHYLAPMPNIGVIADNIRFFAEHGVMGIMEQDPTSRGRERQFMRSWIYAKLLWDPSRDTGQLMQDFIWGYYGKSAPMIAEYNELLQQTGEKHNARETQSCRYAMDVEFLSREFLEAAEKILDRAARRAENDEILGRVQEARLPLMYVKLERGPEFVGEGYPALIDRFAEICRRCDISHISDKARLQHKVKEWQGKWRVYTEMADVAKTSRIQHLSDVWKFAADRDNVGVAEKWFAAGFDDSSWAQLRSDLGMKGWEDQGYAGYDGYGWYRQNLQVPREMEGKRLYLYFGAVDEQAWVYLNGDRAFTHTVASTGQRVGVLWKKPFAFEATGHLVPGQANLLAVRVHDSMAMGGVWQPVYLVASEIDLDTALIKALLARAGTMP